MSCIEKLKCQRVLFALGCALASDGYALTQWTPTPAFRCAIGFSMGEKRIRPGNGATDLLALPGHHVNRVVQKHVADLSRRFGHENACRWKAPHEHRQCAYVVLVSMRNQDRLDILPCDSLEIRQRVFTGVLGMHSAIEHQSMAAHLEII